MRRINQQHGRFEIANGDFLYVLSTFVFEPIRWNHRFGWRLMGEKERLGLFHFWKAVGQRMGIAEIPEEYSAFEAFNRRYEAEHFLYAESNSRVGNAVLDMFCAWFSGFLKPLVRKSIVCLLDDEVIAAFGFERPSPFLAEIVIKSLRLRAWLLGFLPERRRPRLRTQGKHRSYPEGYSIENLGPSGS